MTGPIVEFDGGFSEPGAGPVPWADVTAVLTTAEMQGAVHADPLPLPVARGLVHWSAPVEHQRP